MKLLITSIIILEYPRMWNKQNCSLVDDIKKIQSAVLMNALKGSSSQRERTQKANIKI